MNLAQLWEAVEHSRAWRALVHGGHEESDTTKRLEDDGTSGHDLSFFDVELQTVFLHSPLSSSLRGL